MSELGYFHVNSYWNILGLQLKLLRANAFNKLPIFFTVLSDPVFSKVGSRTIAMVYILNSKRNANVCSDPVQSHYDEKFIHDNRSTSQNKIRAKCSLDICLSNCTVWYSLYTFLHTPPSVSKTANVKTWLTFIQSNIANLICVSFAVQYNVVSLEEQRLRKRSLKLKHMIFFS